MDQNEKIFLDDMRDVMEEMDQLRLTEEFMVDIEPEEELLNTVIFDDELTREDCEELMAKMDEFEKRARERIMTEIRVYTCNEYSQEFLLSLIPKR